MTSFIDRAGIEALLEPWLPAAADRAFVTRCMLGEGPAHHRGANYVLLRLLGELAARVAPAPAVAPDQVPVPIRLPPHVPRPADRDYPLALPRRVVARLAPDAPTQAAMLDCVTDGPPQHALANAAMLCLLDAMLVATDAPR
ncbi:MAG: hypothetical protein IPH44_12105 [Myxococcales bacterium]|nr:hypothetical protein [Myxococcales bacterium]MBP6845480.1 hypothetical protein [Kofleriaceae bacterium]